MEFKEKKSSLKPLLIVIVIVIMLLPIIKPIIEKTDFKSYFKKEEKNIIETAIEYGYNIGEERFYVTLPRIIDNNINASDMNENIIRHIIPITYEESGINFNYEYTIKNDILAIYIYSSTYKSDIRKYEFNYYYDIKNKNDMDQAWALSEMRIDKNGISTGTMQVDDLINECGVLRIEDNIAHFKMKDGCVEEWSKEEYNY